MPLTNRGREMLEGKSPAVWTVRNHEGSLIGRYRAKNAIEAIRKAIEESAAYASTFRASTLRPDGLTAAVES